MHKNLYINMHKNSGYHKLGKTLFRVNYFTVISPVQYSCRDPEITCPGELTSEVKIALGTVEQAIKNRQVYLI